jgi:hypothetical protein
MFEAMIVALGDFQLLKLEDAGACYFDDANGEIRLPDFRALTNRGEDVVIEVKNVPPRNTMSAEPLRIADLDALARYAAATHSRLLYAHYWSVFNTWTLVDTSVISRRGRRGRLELTDALMANELATFGDRMVGTKPPLTMSLIADKHHPRSEVPNTAGEEARFTIADVEFSCGGAAIVDQLERSIALSLMYYGSWPSELQVRGGPDGLIEALDCVSRPAGPADEIEAQGFAFAGTLSSLYSTQYNAATLGDHGAVVALGSVGAPRTIGALVPKDYWDTTARPLPLWLMEVRPSAGPSSPGDP